jgi:glycosyltransferase involved in cell wall biosynthesis
LHIVHVLTRLLRAGTEENTIALARRQREEGHRVTFIHGGQFSLGLRGELLSEFEIIQVPGLVHRISPFEDASALLKLRAALRSLAPQVVHTHQSKAGVVATAAAAGVGVPGVVHGVHILPWVNSGPMRSAAYIAMERAAARFAGAFIDVSEGVRDECLRHRIGAPEQHFVARSPIQLDQFRSAQPPDDLVLPTDGPRPVVVLVLAAFEPRKRQQAFLEALGKLGPDPNLLVVFAGDGPTLPFVAEAAGRLFRPDQVKFLGHRKDPERLIAAAEICVLTSNREGLPRVLLQYLAGGRASVVTDLPGLSDVVNNGVNGVIVDTPEQAAAEVARLVKDAPARAALAAAAAATDLSAWALDQSYPSVVAAYDYALRRSERSRT